MVKPVVRRIVLVVPKLPRLHRTEFLGFATLLFWYIVVFIHALLRPGLGFVWGGNYCKIGPTRAIELNRKHTVTQLRHSTRVYQLLFLLVVANRRNDSRTTTS